jgi:hypothetical protein
VEANSLNEVRRFLLNLLPPGAERLYSLVPGGDVFQLFDAFAATVKQFGFDLLDVLRAEITPAECIQRIPDWETALALASSQAALHGTTAQRRASILARLREVGGFTRALVRSVLAPLLGYADPSTVQLLNTNRAAMRAAHTYAGSVGAQQTPGVFTANVFDGGQVSKAGAQISITLLASAPNPVTLQLAPPGGQRIKRWPAITPGSGNYLSATLAAPELAGAPCGGVWTLTIGGQPSFLYNWSIFVEGVGPGGLGGDVFDWGVYLDPVHLGENGFIPDLRAAQLAIARIQHAHANGKLIRALQASPDTPQAILDQFLPA